MFLTNILLKKAKAKQVLVLMESAVSQHQFMQIRDRLGDKLEVIRYDPYIQQLSVYRERRKVKSIR
ncbi:39S ribosomal protein L33, mitochondrial [Contarinia nasturtii]|uniref:39S ribosomal protein L33, mitochondrial n=1 Tax=Contarinia nasturtii TaxID=265458 RepID=UPI0012D4A701|nr:39S ribosomal protein L33, mitochondrial [Contarinia nasturtii]